MLTVRKTHYVHDGYVYQLAVAAYDAVPPVLRQLVEKKYDINTVDKNGRTMLFCAAKAGHEAAVKFLLEQETIDVDQTDAEDCDPLAGATESGSYEITQALLSKIAIQAKSGGDKQHEGRVGPQGILGLYSLERLRSIQIKASRQSRYGNRTEMLEMLL